MCHTSQQWPLEPQWLGQRAGVRQRDCHVPRVAHQSTDGLQKHAVGPVQVSAGMCHERPSLVGLCSVETHPARVFDPVVGRSAHSSC